MSNNKTGGAAFPVTATEQSFHNQTPLHGEPDMTLLDYMAAKAMQTLIKQIDYSPYNVMEDAVTADELATQSYAVAAAMLRERQKYIS